MGLDRRYYIEKGRVWWNMFVNGLKESISPQSHVDATRPSSSYSPPEERKTSTASAVNDGDLHVKWWCMTAIYIALVFRKALSPSALCNNIRGRSAESVFKRSQYKVVTNTFLSPFCFAKCFCKFKLRHFQSHPLGNRNLDQSLLEMSHPSLLSPLARKHHSFHDE